MNSFYITILDLYISQNRNTPDLNNHSFLFVCHKMLSELIIKWQNKIIELLIKQSALKESCIHCTCKYRIQQFKILFTYYI